jgi:cell division protein FtsN
VVVGAFITREGAERQKSELQSKGIPNEIIER